MVQIILEHPYLSFISLCVVIEGITSIIKNILNYKLDKKSNTDFGLKINGGNDDL